MSDTSSSSSPGVMGSANEDDLRVAHDLFDDLAGPGAEHIPAKKLDEMRKRLIADGERIKAHVDQYVADRDRNPDFEPATWDDLRMAIDGMAEALATVGRAVDGTWRMADPTFQFEWYEFMQRPLFQRPIDDQQLRWPPHTVSFD